MFMAFCGMIDYEDIDRCIRGNGKTNAMTYYLYKYHLTGKEIWTNYETSFSSKVIGFQEMIDNLFDLKENKEESDIILGVIEMGQLIKSIGSTKNQVLFISHFTSQLRKLNADCFYDTQIFKELHINLRRHTENIRICEKLHLNGSPCYYDRCEKLHLIDVYSYKPFRRYPIRRIKAYEVGKLYDSSEMITDVLKVEDTDNKKGGKNGN